MPMLFLTVCTRESQRPAGRIHGGQTALQGGPNVWCLSDSRREAVCTAICKARECIYQS